MHELHDRSAVKIQSEYTVGLVPIRANLASAGGTSCLSIHLRQHTIWGNARRDCQVCSFVDLVSYLFHNLKSRHLVLLHVPCKAKGQLGANDTSTCFKYPSSRPAIIRFSSYYLLKSCHAVATNLKEHFPNLLGRLNVKTEVKLRPARKSHNFATAHRMICGQSFFAMNPAIPERHPNFLASYCRQL